MSYNKKELCWELKKNQKSQGTSYSGCKNHKTLNYQQCRLHTKHQNKDPFITKLLLYTYFLFCSIVYLYMFLLQYKSYVPTTTK